MGFPENVRDDQQVQLFNSERINQGDVELITLLFRSSTAFNSCIGHVWNLTADLKAISHRVRLFHLLFPEDGICVVNIKAEVHVVIL